MRNYAKAVFVFSALALVGACTDKDAVAPAAQTPSFVAPANFAKVVGNTVAFRVSNSSGITQRIGNHLISIPANAICAIGTSGYGAEYWDQPCSPLKGSIVIKATVLEDADGMPYVDFQPAMRFSPDKEVMLFLRQGKNSNKKELNVQWCNNTGFCIDESLTDASLKPFRVGRTPVVGRRVKHFSGYLINYGEGCRGSVVDNGDGTYWCEDGGFMRRSGYMVASGKDVTDAMKDDDKKPDTNKKEQ